MFSLKWVTVVGTGFAVREDRVPNSLLADVEMKRNELIHLIADVESGSSLSPRRGRSF